MELAAVVLGEERDVLAQRRRQLLEEQRVGAGEGELDGRFVDL